MTTRDPETPDLLSPLSPPTSSDADAPLSAQAAPRGPNGDVAAEPDYLQGLNAEQREAVVTTEGPVLVLAGAGTGKTRALTTRLAHLLATGKAKPWQILAVTFTNKAAREMRQRTGALVGQAVEGMQWLGTFHSIGAQILRRHAEIVDLKSNFTILDTDDQIRLCKQVIADAGLDEKRWTGRALAFLLDGWKNKGLTPDRLTAADAAAFAGGRGQELYAAYQARMTTLNAADFGDLLVHGLTIFQKSPDILADFHDRFRYILVDEYQDTNTAQYLWLRLLAQKRKNICCVGDDDQSIYGWRGAEVENILRFETDFPGAAVIRLERNYRSTPAILAAASRLISANEDRLGKTLWTDQEDGDPLKLRGVWDGEEEARAVGEEIEAMQVKGRRLSDIAVLVRASFQMRSFEDRFINLGLPYRVVGGPRFFEREEIRDAHAYLRLVRSGADDLAFERIVNKPRRGLGDKALQTLRQAARARGGTLMDAARALTTSDELTARTRKPLKAFLDAVDRWAGLLASDMRHTELAEIILDESGYTEMWQADKSPQAPSKLENLKELIQAMADFENLEGYLDHVSLVMDNDQNAEGERINLMTLHSAKGLEFPVVFLPGWEEGVFPSQRSMDESGQAGLEEERRLAYVGITRAREEAHISFAANRQIYGRWQSAIPSRFIDELPKEQVDVVTQPGLYGASASSLAANQRFQDVAQNEGGYYENPGWRRARAAFTGGGGKPNTAPPIEADAKLVAVSDPNAAKSALGERIFHQKFGYGRIRAIEGNKLVVDFEKAGQKRVIESFVERV
ncbi:MAG: UvrD-helicase domain-containing protein [Pseudomonadota bacterium]